MKYTAGFLCWLGIGLGVFSAAILSTRAGNFPTFLATVPLLSAFLAGGLLISCSKNIFARIWGGIVVLAAVLSQAVMVPQNLWWVPPVLITAMGVVFSRYAGSGFANLVSFLFGMVGLGILLSPVIPVQYLAFVATAAFIHLYLGFILYLQAKPSDSIIFPVNLLLWVFTLMFGLMFYIMAISSDYFVFWITDQLKEIVLAILAASYLTHITYKCFFVKSFEESVEAASRFYWEVIDLFLPINGKK